MNWKKLCFVFASVLAVSHTRAAELPTPLNSPALAPQPPTPLNSPALAPQLDWTGPYLGINGGAAWGTSRQDRTLAPGGSTGDFDISGGLAGGTVGYKFQLDNIVYGLEGDLDWAGIRGTAPCANPAFSCTTQNDYLGTTRAILGYSFDRWLPYVTGGAALGDIRESFSPAIGANSGATSDRVGWTAGGGLAFRLSRDWSANLEYLYVDLGTFSCNNVACSGVSPQTINTRLFENLFRAGIQYRFGSPPNPF
jgi:outer membrane immunogenic protein